MKRLFILLLIAILSFSQISCKESGNSEPSQQSDPFADTQRLEPPEDLDYKTYLSLFGKEEDREDKDLDYKTYLNIVGEEEDGEVTLYTKDYTEFLEWVDSTCFSSVGFDEEEDILVVEFLESGSVYIYYDVPYWQYLDLIYADSIGGYYNDYIKGQYISERIE